MTPPVQRVLMTTDTVGGVFTYSCELAAALGRRGVQVTLASMGAPISPDQRRWLEQLPLCSVQESTFKLEWMPAPWADVSAAGAWLLELAGELRPDIIHLNQYAHGPLPWNAPIVMVAHSCVLSWWRAVHACAAPSDWNTYRQRVLTGLRSADLVIAPTQAMLADLQREYGTLPQTRVIPNGQHAPPSLCGTKSQFIFTAGRLWDKAKNIAALQAVAPKLDWPVVVAGDAGTTGLRNVQALGHVGRDQIQRLFQRAAIYALPARYEPFGLSALEAALTGCALVLGDIPSLREVWGDAARYVRPDDTKDLEATLRDLIANTNARVEAGRRARERALQYTPEAMAAAYLAAYADIAEVPCAS